ncbi:MAG: SDR family NAD(P)-dependent oxidoreductase [Clostridiales bacterium]|nr:SDR family NAD(P)-dependent oxidoreductase [Clostridiales bacterium]
MKNWIFDKTIVLTGASGGIGRELTKLFITKYHANVIGIGRNENKMLSLKEELGENAARFSYRLFDVSEKENWVRFAAELTEQGTSVALLVNNAGAFPSFTRIENTPTETTERIMRINYFSAVYAVNALSPILVGERKHKPAIINVASSAALCTVVGTAAYSASKAALKGFTEALQMEEKGKRYVGIVYPGTTKTDLFRDDKNTENSALDLIAMPAAKMAKKIARKILRKRRRAVVGWDAKLMNLTAKLSPVKGLGIIRFVMKKSKSKVFSEVFPEEYTANNKED